VIALTQYLDSIVEPTYEDFKRNPRSLRHAYLACLVTYHAIDRAAYPKSPGNLRKQWKKASNQFAIVDMVAHKIKHVVSNDEKHRPESGIPLSSLVFGLGAPDTAQLNTVVINDAGVDLHNLFYVIRDAITFLRKEANVLEEATDEPVCGRPRNGLGQKSK
jgi:hypothetical protein